MPPEKTKQKPQTSKQELQTNPPTMFHFKQMGKKKIKQVFILETVSIKILLHNLILVGRWQGNKKDIRRCVLIKMAAAFSRCCERWRVTPDK